MKPLDDLFSTDESRAEAHLEKVVTLNPADISDFPNHPFKVKQDEAMAEMVDSVKQYGVLVPALVRPKADGGYEIAERSGVIQEKIKAVREDEQPERKEKTDHVQFR